MTCKPADPGAGAHLFDDLIPEHAQKQVVDALKMAYRKHVCDDDSIAWQDLDSALTDAMCESLGNERFLEWSESFDD